MTTNSPKNAPFRRKGDLGIPMVIGIFVVAFILGTLLFFNYAKSEKEINDNLLITQQQSKMLSIQQCAEKNMEWYQSCQAMNQLCDNTISRMIKVCLTSSDKFSQCKQFGESIYGYNFGAEQCAPYFSNRSLKKACADTWQAIADYCKAARKQ